MEAKKPGCLPSAARLFISPIVVFIGIVAYLEYGYSGPVGALFGAICIALAVRWFLLGLLGLARPLPARAKTYGAAAGLAVLLVLLGKPVSSSYLKGREPECWKKVLGTDSEEFWKREYDEKVPPEFRRAEYTSRRSDMICADALKNKDFRKIREQAQKTFGEDSKEYDDQARQKVSAAYHQLLQDGLKTLKPTKLADKEMTEAFRKMLEAIGDKPTRLLYFHFEASGTLGKTPADAEFLSNLRAPYNKLPVLGVGDAFSKERYERRSVDVKQAIQESFDSVWPKGMLSLEPSTPEPRPDDVHMYVKARVHRIPGFYVNTNEKNKPDAFLYKCEVAWQCRVVVQGKEAGSFDFRSEPAKHVSYRTDQDDPAWAPYSIIMDSASANFARLLVGRLGLTPPPANENYTFK